MAEERVQDPPAFEILAPPSPGSALVAHIPHSSTRIPSHVREELLPDDDGLARELLRLTDWHTDALFAWTGDLGAVRLVNRVSRLVVDPERFADDEREPMARVGQGVVYVRTVDGTPLRRADAQLRRSLVEQYYSPWHAALTGLVEEALDVFGRCLVLDCHSFATVPLPSESDRSTPRPDICLGTDPVHTPPPLVDALRASLEADGFSVELDRPFAGSMVPMRWYGTDARVSTVMLEVRRGTYCDERTARPTEAFDRVAASLRRAADRAVSEWGFS